MMKQSLVEMEQSLHRSLKLNQRYELVIDKLAAIQPKSSTVSDKLAEVEPKLRVASAPLPRKMNTDTLPSYKKVKKVKKVKGKG